LDFVAAALTSGLKSMHHTIGLLHSHKSVRLGVVGHTCRAALTA